MFRRQPALSVVLVVYLAALGLLCLSPNGLVARAVVATRRTVPGVSAAGVELIIDALLFVPVGLLLVLLMGRRRWLGIVLFGVITSCWIQLAQMVLTPSEPIESRAVVAHMAGCVGGVVLALAIVSMRRHARQSRQNTALTPVSQSNAPRL